MAKTPTTILLEVNDRGAERPIQEADAGGTIKPGHLVEFDGSGDLIVHATSGGNAQKLFAIEDPYRTPTSNSAIDNTYVATNLARYIRAQSGDVVYGLLVDEGNVAKGDPLVSQGDGSVDTATIDATTLAGAVVGYAAEAVNYTGGSGEVRLRIVVA